jgi:hypothetical protein
MDTNKHEYILKGPSPQALSPKQRNAIYWRAWNAAERAQPGLNRFAITARICGHVKKIQELSDEEFRKIVHAFESIAKRSEKIRNQREVTNALSTSRGTTERNVGGRYRPVESRTPSSDFQRGVEKAPKLTGNELAGAEGADIRQESLPGRNAQPIHTGAASTSEQFDSAHDFPTYSESQLREAHRRQKLIEQLGLLTNEHGLSMNAAAKELGEAVSSLCRYKNAYAARGFDGLIPKLSTGRKPLAELSEEHQREVHKLVVQTDPNTGTRISVSMALRLFAHSDKCPEDVSAVILKPRASKHSITPTLKRQARVTAETKMLYRGNKNFALNGYSQPRSLTWIDIAGVERPIEPGDCDERDDMTLNQPWYVEWQDDGTDPCAAAFGVKLLRGQLLVNLDVGSQRGLSFELLARPYDSYRADDIWAWIGRDYREIGLPRFGERMERGIWEAKAIHGIPIAPGAWNHDVRLGGLGALGVKRITSYSPHTKSIESFFNLLQKVLGCTGVQVGRKRGEFEKATKDWLACRAGKKHPTECGFLHADELVRRIANAIGFLNGDPREGEVYRGIPDELWKESIAKNPLRRLDPSQAWIFHSVKREESIRDGMVRVRFAEHDCSYWFTNPDIFAQLGRGYGVIVCFDPAAPEHAVIFSNDNRGAYRPGQQICVAELVERVPQYSAMDGFDDRAGYERRRRFTAQCRKAYRAIALPGARDVAATVVRDSRGNESRVETGFCRASVSDASPGVSQKRPTTIAFDETAALTKANRLEQEFLEREVGIG